MMDFQFLWNAIRREIQAALAQAILKPRHGIVTSWDPDTHSAKFLLQPGDDKHPDGVPTGWVNVGTQAAGNGFGFSVAPSIGDQALLIGVEGDSNSWHVINWLHSDEDKAMGLKAGEGKWRGAGGSEVSMDKSGNLTVKHSSGAQTALTSSGIVHTDETGFETHMSGGVVRFGGASASQPVMVSGPGGMQPSTKLFSTG